MKKVSIHKEGKRILFYLFLGLLILNIGVEQFTPGFKELHIGLLAASIIAFSAIASFFRNPIRLTTLDNQTVVSPADGKVVAIEEVEEGEYFKDRRLQVSIFMSPANVHVNRHPISGIVKYIKYHPGKYLVAWHPKSSQKNEHNSVVIEDDGVEILIRQIAGALARRIVSYIDEGDEVTQGNELGFIKFGSRVDLFLPIDAEVKVNLQQKVKGGESIIAQLI